MNLPAKLEIGTDPADKFKVNSEEALAFCMRDLVFPARLSNLEAAVFNHSMASISRIFNDVIDLLYHTLLDLDIRLFSRLSILPSVKSILCIGSFV